MPRSNGCARNGGRRRSAGPQTCVMEAVWLMLPVVDPSTTEADWALRGGRGPRWRRTEDYAARQAGPFAAPCQGEGRGFESRLPLSKNLGVPYAASTDQDGQPCRGP